MSSQMTHSSQVVNHIEYVEEATYDTFPTNPTMLFLANVGVVRISKTENKKGWRRHGSEDPFKFIKGKREATLSIEGVLPDAAAAINFIRYGINAINAANTIAKSLSLGWSYKLNNVTNYRKASGCRIQTLRLMGSVDTPEIKWTADLVPATITAPGTTDYIGTGAHGTASTDAIIAYHTGGNDPILFNAVAVPATSINAVWTRNLSNKHILGKRNIKYQYPTNRAQVGDMSVVTIDKALEDAMEADTQASLVWTIRSGTTITWSNAQILEIPDETIDSESTEGAETAVGFEALSSAIA